MHRYSKAITLLVIGPVIALTIFANGCASHMSGSVVTDQQKAAIINGTTTKTDLLREFGNPDQTLDLGNGKEELSYIREEWGFGARKLSATEFWVDLNKGVVQDFGERPTTKAPAYSLK